MGNVVPEPENAPASKETLARNVGRFLEDITAFDPAPISCLPDVPAYEPDNVERQFQSLGRVFRPRRPGASAKLRRRCARPSPDRPRPGPTLPSPTTRPSPTPRTRLRSRRRRWSTPTAAAISASSDWGGSGRCGQACPTTAATSPCCSSTASGACSASTTPKTTATRIRRRSRAGWRTGASSPGSHPWSSNSRIRCFRCSLWWRRSATARWDAVRWWRCWSPCAAGASAPRVRPAARRRAAGRSHPTGIVHALRDCFVHHQESPGLLRTLFEWHHRVGCYAHDAVALRRLMGVTALDRHSATSVYIRCGVLLDGGRVCTATPYPPFTVCGAHWDRLLRHE